MHTRRYRFGSPILLTLAFPLCEESNSPVQAYVVRSNYHSGSMGFPPKYAKASTSIFLNQFKYTLTSIQSHRLFVVPNMEARTCYSLALGKTQEFIESLCSHMPHPVKIYSYEKLNPLHHFTTSAFLCSISLTVLYYVFAGSHVCHKSSAEANIRQYS